MSLTEKILWSMGLGIIAGLFINLGGFNAEGSFVNDYIVGGLFYVIGKMFITALKMLVVPLVFFSLISGVLGIGDLSKLGKVGVKSFALYMLTTAIAIAVAIAIASLVIPLFSTPTSAAAAFAAKEAPPLSDVLINII
ncbi:MAG: cation:dicarboxylase symporter family transporter, partial [Sulfurovum sp.]|nr:cation:dicarboxylase symporter family transporter [Sulfurovum sp.]